MIEKVPSADAGGTVFYRGNLAESAHADLAGVSFGKSLKGGELDKILSREDIWGYNVLESPLCNAVVSAFESMNAGPGSVRRTLHNTVA